MVSPLTCAGSSPSTLAKSDRVLIVDESGDLKKGEHTVGVHRRWPQR
jgi:SRSO17 transposase